jgi:hypothetical protein
MKKDEKMRENHRKWSFLPHLHFFSLMRGRKSPWVVHDVVEPGVQLRLS